MFRKTIAVLATMTFTALASLFIFVTPASAAMQCRSNDGVFPTAGVYTDVTVKLCVASEEDSAGDEVVQARAYIYWSRPVQPVVDAFEQFDLALRLENNNANVLVHTCHLKDYLNSKRSGSTYCDTVDYAEKVGGGWTADGVVNYNINNDGTGAHSWTLHGSPSI